MTTDRAAMIRRALQAATEAMHACGAVQPMIIAHLPDGRLFAMLMTTAMLTTATKDIAARMIGAKLRAERAEAYVFMSEAWRADRLPDDDPLSDLAPSERADRIEILVLSASDHQGDDIMTWRTVRNSRGRFVRFEPLDDTARGSGHDADGRFLGLLREPASRTTH